jgi:hypothetical protein
MAARTIRRHREKSPIPIAEMRWIRRSIAGTRLAARPIVRKFDEGAPMALLRIASFAAGALVSAAIAMQVERTSWPLSQAPAELRPAISRADLVMVEMQGTVLGELTRALDRTGAAGAATFCHLDVTDVFQRVSGRGVIAAGRTSDRLRNPRNAPRAWAAPFVNAHAGAPARSVDGFAVDLGDSVGVLRPIVEQSMCEGCHGRVDRLAPGVREMLRDRYPADRAVGFKDGDIRGWFWVEIAKR